MTVPSRRYQVSPHPPPPSALDVPSSRRQRPPVPAPVRQSVEPWLLPPLRTRPCSLRLQPPPRRRGRALPPGPRTAGAVRRPRIADDVPGQFVAHLAAQPRPSAPPRPPGRRGHAPPAAARVALARRARAHHGARRAHHGARRAHGRQEPRQRPKDAQDHHAVREHTATTPRQGPPGATRGPRRRMSGPTRPTRTYRPDPATRWCKASN